MLCYGGRYREVYLVGLTAKDASSVKEVRHNIKNFIVYIKTRQAQKEAADREALISSLEEQLKKVLKVLSVKISYTLERLGRRI